MNISDSKIIDFVSLKEGGIMNKNIKLIGICALLLALPNVMAVIFVPSNANINNELSESENYQENHKEVKNIILMVPDGMGLADVTAAGYIRTDLMRLPFILKRWRTSDTREPIRPTAS